MKRDIPTEAGIGFTLIVAAATFAVAVIAGIFLIWESGGTPSAQFRGPGQTQSQVSLIAPDVQRGPQTERSPVSGSGINPAPIITQ